MLKFRAAIAACSSRTSVTPTSSKRSPKVDNTGKWIVCAAPPHPTRPSRRRISTFLETHVNRGLRRAFKPASLREEPGLKIQSGRQFCESEEAALRYTAPSVFPVLGQPRGLRIAEKIKLHFVPLSAA